jgi:hypothetical protein
MKIRLFNKIVLIAVVDAPGMETYGVLNRTSDGYYVPFFDFDGVRLDVVEEAASWLDKNFELGPLIVRKSSSFFTDDGTEIGSYHLIGFSKLTLPEFENILSKIWCDRGFKAGYKLEPERAWVLRVAEKVDLKTGEIVKPFCTFVKLYNFKTCRILNAGLLKFFQTLDKFKVNGCKLDDLDDFYLIHYWGKSKQKELIKHENKA